MDIIFFKVIVIVLNRFGAPLCVVQPEMVIMSKDINFYDRHVRWAAGNR